MSVIVNENGEIVQVVVKEIYGKDGADGQDYQVDDFADFTGELDVSGDFQPYNDYSGAEITSLSLSTTKKRGATGNVRIKGGSISVNALTNLGTVLPAGATISTDVNQWNEIDYQYLSDTHIRIILTVLDSNFQPIATSQPAGDTTAPTIQSATIEDSNPDKVVVPFDETVNITDLTGISLSGTGAPAINSVSGSGTNTLTFTLASAATGGEVWTLEVAAGNNIQDAAGNGLAATSQAITNNVSSTTDLNTLIQTNGEWYNFTNKSVGLVTTGGTGEKSGYPIDVANGSPEYITGTKLKTLKAENDAIELGAAMAFLNNTSDGFSIYLKMNPIDLGATAYFLGGNSSTNQVLVYLSATGQLGMLTKIAGGSVVGNITSSNIWSGSAPYAVKKLFIDVDKATGEVKFYDGTTELTKVANNTIGTLDNISLTAEWYLGGRNDGGAMDTANDMSGEFEHLIINPQKFTSVEKQTIIDNT